MKAGFQLGIHAIGDAGNREVLDFLEAEFKADPTTAQGRHRIEHAQVISPQDQPRFARLGVIASMEPPHAVEDKGWAEDRLGPQRILGAYAWRSLRTGGARLTFNADNPGSDHSIFYGLHAAITRQDKQRQPPGGWYPEQRLTIEEAIRAYTSWSAHAAFREDQTGIIAKGRWADLTVMDIDPFALAATAPEKSWPAGFERPSSAASWFISNRPLAAVVRQISAGRARLQIFMMREQQRAQHSIPPWQRFEMVS